MGVKGRGGGGGEAKYYKGLFRLGIILGGKVRIHGYSYHMDNSITTKVFSYLSKCLFCALIQHIYLVYLHYRASSSKGGALLGSDTDSKVCITQQGLATHGITLMAGTINYVGLEVKS